MKTIHIIEVGKGLILVLNSVLVQNSVLKELPQHCLILVYVEV
jgi:hypothetical protein